MEITPINSLKAEVSLSKLGNQGQAVTEYILLLSVVVTFYMVVSAGMEKFQLSKKLTNLIAGPFSAAYTYGHTKAKGYDNGGPKYHPRADGENSFRIFLNHTGS